MVFLPFSYSRHLPWKELHLPKAVQHRDAVRAVILAGSTSNNLIELLNNKGITHVVPGNNILGEHQHLKTDIVFSDDIEGSHEMPHRLIGMGHRQIWFVGNTRLPWFTRCYEGYRRSMSPDPYRVKRYITVNTTTYSLSEAAKILHNPS